MLRWMEMMEFHVQTLFYVVQLSVDFRILIGPVNLVNNHVFRWRHISSNIYKFSNVSSKGGKRTLLC